jgi:amino acid transporter
MFSAIKAVLSAFLGIRKQSDYDEDVKKLSAKQVIITGIVLTLLIVIALIFVVKILTAKPAQAIKKASGSPTQQNQPHFSHYASVQNLKSQSREIYRG